MKEDRGVVGVSKAYLPHKEISLIVGHQQVCFSPVEVKKKKKGSGSWLQCSFHLPGVTTTAHGARHSSPTPQPVVL